MKATSHNGNDLLDLLAEGEPPAFAVDDGLRIVFWNRGAERVLGQSAALALGRRCFDVLGGRDVFGNRYCHAGCVVAAMTRREEEVRSFELQVTRGSRFGTQVQVSVLTQRGCRPELSSIIHLLAPLDPESRLARVLSRSSSRRRALPRDRARHPLTSWGDGVSLTQREREVLGWVAGGLRNKEIARTLEISLATVRNHVHNLLGKIGVHSKLEAVSLGFRRGWLASRREAPRG